MKIKKNKICLGIALATITMTGALVSQPVLAHKNAKPHAHQVSAERLAEAANNKAEVLEAQLRAMQDEIASLRAQIGTTAPVAAADTQKVQELDAWMASVKSEPVKAKSKDNMMFFRGGYAHNNTQRGGTLDPSAAPLNANGELVGPITDKDGYYFGAGFDFSLDDNLWGLMDNTEVLAELMFDYKEFANNKPNGLSPGAFPTLALNTQSASVNQLSLSASPKIKFMKGKAFRPWLIPVGFELDVISPPSDAITVLTPAMQFGLGADYKVWKSLYVGADFRYHYAPGGVDGVSVNGLTTGGYLGIGF
ncbi:MAG: porin family protein [Methylococcaceae bacterium]